MILMLSSLICAKLHESATLKGSSSHKRKMLQLCPFLQNLTLILLKKIQLIVCLESWEGCLSQSHLLFFSYAVFFLSLTHYPSGILLVPLIVFCEFFNLICQSSSFLLITIHVCIPVLCWQQAACPKKMCCYPEGTASNEADVMNLKHCVLGFALLSIHMIYNRKILSSIIAVSICGCQNFYGHIHLNLSLAKVPLLRKWGRQNFKKIKHLIFIF